MMSNGYAGCCVKEESRVTVRLQLAAEIAPWISLGSLSSARMRPERGFANVAGTRLRYEVAGSGRAVVLIHGGAMDMRMWDDQMEPFAQRYRVVRYDVRGHGRSALPSGESYSRPDELKALLDHLGIRHAAIVGFSWAEE